MATTPRDRLDREKRKVWELVGEGRMAARTATRLCWYADILDVANVRHVADDLTGEPYQAEPRTVETYLRCLRIATTDGVDPTDCTAAEYSSYMDDRHDDGDGLSKSTLVGYQAAARSFFHIFDLGVDPEDVKTYIPDSKPRHDVQDMFTPDEVWALRRAVGRTRHPVRNRAFLELLIFTGQRILALLTLKVGDIEPDAGETGYLYLNDEVDGLKGALVRGRQRPLFGARKYVREWLEARDGDGEDWLFVGDPNHWKTSAGDHWAEPSADRLLRQVQEYAGVDKPINAHNFRHYNVTVLRRDYDRGWEEINALHGVIKGSNSPKTTYSHIDDARLMRDLEVGMGFAEDEDRNRFTPPVCDVCEEILRPDWRKCPACDTRYAPGEDDGREEREWLAEEMAVGPTALDRALARVVDRALDNRAHDEAP